MARCKLGHRHPIVVERTSRALRSRAVCRLRRRRDSQRAAECWRSHLGVKAVVGVLGDRRRERAATFEFFVLGAARISAGLMYLNFHVGTELLPLAVVCCV